MEITAKTNLKQLLVEYPEAEEFLWPFLSSIYRNTTIQSLAVQADLPVDTFISGLRRLKKRVDQNPCDFTQFNERLIKPGYLNIAGFVHFICHPALTGILQDYAIRNSIKLNLNLFAKHEKPVYQNYLAKCKSVDELPDIIIGKGFSSLVTSRFIDHFIKPGNFENKAGLPFQFKEWGFTDEHNSYQTFAVEEMLIALDKTIPSLAERPQKWDDLLNETFKGKITQMGKNQDDHFGFTWMFYLYKKHGIQGITKYAANVGRKEPFARIIKNMGQNLKDNQPVNILHGFTQTLLRSVARDNVDFLQPVEGNPATAHYFLVKKEGHARAFEISRLLYSDPVNQVFDRCGFITGSSLPKPTKFQWIGWDTIYHSNLPYLKEFLSYHAHNSYQNKTTITTI